MGVAKSEVSTAKDRDHVGGMDSYSKSRGCVTKSEGHVDIKLDWPSQRNGCLCRRDG